MFCICFGTYKIEVREIIFYFSLIWPANYFIFHNFVYTDIPCIYTELIFHGGI